MVILLPLAVLFTGCAHRTNTHITVPPPPVSESSSETATEKEAGKNAEPEYMETGIAAWYPPYHNRRSANGEVYDGSLLTAAHRTLPLNTVARITNLQTNHSVVVRITDRGPFIEGRMLDLSVQAAKQIDVWRTGLALVKLEVLWAPASIEHGGRWCVQIGAFNSGERATQFKEELKRRYPTAELLQFPGPAGKWLRIRLKGDDKERTALMWREITAPEGAAFLTRLD